MKPSIVFDGGWLPEEFKDRIEEAVHHWGVLHETIAGTAFESQVEGQEAVTEALVQSLIDLSYRKFGMIVVVSVGKKVMHPADTFVSEGIKKP